VIVARCPACGAEVPFKRDGSMVVVCAYCSAVVARGDRGFESLGKIADLIETGSPLQLGLHGRIGGVDFELVGRTQLQHELGGVWDEWYAALADGRWGWLAEAQGCFYLTFEQPIPEEGLPLQGELQVGEPAPIPGPVDFVTAEKGSARLVSGRGEIPFRVEPGAAVAYADLSGPAGEFATLDYSQSPPAYYAGRQVTLAELGLGGAPAAEHEARHVKGAELRCPQCGGPLELRAPERSKRVTCPSCGALLDCAQGRLAWLQALEPPPPAVAPVLPLGSTGALGDNTYTVVGFVVRSVEEDGQRWPWQEYLLYEPLAGFRWLTCSGGHWSFVAGVPPGQVTTAGRTASWRGRPYRLFQDGMARVDHVLGELYWEVKAGEEVQTADFVRPPEMLSKEWSEAEVNWSVGTYLSPKEVARAFGVDVPLSTEGVAPNQPGPHQGVYRIWGWMLLATFAVGLVIMGTRKRQSLFDHTFAFEPMASAQAAQTVFSDPFDVAGRRNLRVVLSAQLDGRRSWVYVDGDLIDEATGLVQSFSAPLEPDEEGSPRQYRSAEIYLPALPAGRYTLRLEAQWENFAEPLSDLAVHLELGVPRPTHVLGALGLISIIPILVFFARAGFEKRRWENSSYSALGGTS
jgi:hypothetical protein